MLTWFITLRNMRSDLSNITRITPQGLNMSRFLSIAAKRLYNMMNSHEKQECFDTGRFDGKVTAAKEQI